MTLIKTHKIQRHRLALECDAIGLDNTGSRAELVNRLGQAGIYEIHADKTPTRIMRVHNHSNIILGNIPTDNEINNKLLVQNNHYNEPLITGDFKANTITLPGVVNIKNTELCAETQGKEGDIRRMDDELFMYRSTDVSPGWYRIQFGSILII
tara:strand:- start:3379 stop:3837 length:459 start_codon:yes stop_codon:yes gene_type:complete